MPIRSRNRLFILMPIRIRILPQVLHMLENLNFFFYNWLQCQFTLFCLYHQCHRCHNFLYFGQPTLVKCSISLHWLEMDTDPDRKVLVLDADHDTYHPAKWCWSDRFRMHKTANLGSTAILICTVTYVWIPILSRNVTQLKTHISQCYESGRIPYSYVEGSRSPLSIFCVNHQKCLILTEYEKNLVSDVF